MPEELSSKWDGLVPRPRFDEYAEKYQDYFVMERRDGIIQLRTHTAGGSYVHSMAGHNAFAQAWQEVGNDPENEVLILTGTSDAWYRIDPNRLGGPVQDRTPDEAAKLYYDASKLLDNLIFSVDIPTIAAINGPGPHTEIALACDITLCTEDATFSDGHFAAGMAPGDGQGLALQELVGTKRAAYYLYTCDVVDGRTALELGLVNEVLPRERLLPRAREIAELIMRKSRNTRRLTHAIVNRPWRRRLVDEFGFHLAHQLFGTFADKADTSASTRAAIAARDASTNAL